MWNVFRFDPMAQEVCCLTETKIKDIIGRSPKLIKLKDYPFVMVHGWTNDMAVNTSSSFKDEYEAFGESWTAWKHRWCSLRFFLYRKGNMMGTVDHWSEPLTELVVLAGAIWFLELWATFSRWHPTSMRWTSSVKIWTVCVLQKRGEIHWL